MKNILLIIICLLGLTGVEAQVCVGTAGQVEWQCWRNLFDDELGELSALENYPLSPDVSQTIYSLQSPINFDNYMGGKIAGFISVPVSDNVIFNITGDDKTRFYLSSDADPTNMVLRAYQDNWSNIEEHDKYPEQTSDSIFLTAGNFYYFEMIYVEGGGGDHVSLWWKTDNVTTAEWRIVTSAFLNGVDCLPTACPPRGTPCDDGDALTFDDFEDGFCNCAGQAETSNNCIGERQKILSYIYDSIPGSTLNDLYEHPNFPGLPYTSVTHHVIGTPYGDHLDSIGTLVQGYISVPVTGQYKFNVTGNNETIFFLSSDEDPANKQSHQIFVTGGTDPVEHDKYIFQSTSFITLNKGQYYYFELNHKESSYSEHYSVFWQTPFTETGKWKRIPDFYIYDYECEVACIPEGNPCDDGNIFTNNDVYNNSCDCVGTPCSGPDCDDPLASYVPYAKCNVTDQLDNIQNVNWLSCDRAASPNTLRDTSHWVKYDFGQLVELQQTQVWNFNESGGTQQGFEMVAVDYSQDGSNWTELGVYNWNLATGADDYSGFVGPHFGGVTAQYVLITSLDDPNTEACRGFGKVAFTTLICSNFGDPCDDGNPTTANDSIGYNCLCVGESIMLNDCIIDNLALGDTLLPGETYSAIMNLSSANLIQQMDTVNLVAGIHIDLLPGFESPLNSELNLIIEPCPENEQEESEQQKAIDRFTDNDYLRVVAIEDSDLQIIEFLLKEKGHTQIDIYNTQGEWVHTIIDHEYRNRGYFYKRLRTVKMEPGVYQVILKAPGIKEAEKLIVL
jgi:hypothetical protein